MEENQTPAEPEAKPEVTSPSGADESVDDSTKSESAAASPEPKEVEDETPAEPVAGSTITPGKKDFTPPSKPKSKNWLWILLVIIIVAGGVAAWYLLGGKKSSNNSSNSSASQSQTSPTNSYTPVNVAYAFKDSSSPFTLYTRPAVGGDRKEATPKLATSETIDGGDSYGENVVFSTNKAIYVSTDEGETYKAVVTLGANEQITSLKLATDGQSIAYGDLPTTGGKNQVKSMSLDGGNVKTLFTSDKSGVVITAYNSGKQQIVYEEGCWDCDGFSGPLTLRDIKTGKTTELFSATTASQVGDMAVSDDFSSVIYVQGTVDTTAQGLGVNLVAPYLVKTLTLTDSSKVLTLTTFGTKGEKNTNGTLKSREVHVGFVTGTNTPFYTSDAQLYEVKSGTASLVYTADNPILFIPFVGDDNIIAGAGQQTADYTLNNYTISTKKTVKIFSGDNNTIIFGVTTK